MRRRAAGSRRFSEPAPIGLPGKQSAPFSESQPIPGFPAIASPSTKPPKLSIDGWNSQICGFWRRESATGLYSGKPLSTAGQGPLMTDVQLAALPPLNGAASSILRTGICPLSVASVGQSIALIMKPRAGSHDCRFFPPDRNRTSSAPIPSRWRLDWYNEIYLSTISRSNDHRPKMSRSYAKQQRAKSS